MSKKNGKKKVNFEDVVWVIDNLSSSQLTAHDKKPYSPQEIIHKLSEMVEDGFGISIKWDSYNNCLLATATCMMLGYDNSGLALSARGEDATDCYSILLYKYYNVAKRDLRGFSEKVPKGVRG